MSFEKIPQLIDGTVRWCTKEQLARVPAETMQRRLEAALLSMEGVWVNGLRVVCDGVNAAGDRVWRVEADRP